MLDYILMVGLAYFFYLFTMLIVVTMPLWIVASIIINLVYIRENFAILKNYFNKYDIALLYLPFLFWILCSCFFEVLRTSQIHPLNFSKAYWGPAILGGFIAILIIVSHLMRDMIIVDRYQKKFSIGILAISCLAAILISRLTLIWPAL